MDLQSGHNIRATVAVQAQHGYRTEGPEKLRCVGETEHLNAAAESARARNISIAPCAAIVAFADLTSTDSGCDALHPGYGFLSARAMLAQLCEDNGLIFVGPRPAVIDAIGDKLRARAMAKAAGVPLVPGSEEIASPADARREADRIGYPVLLKASAGGGGRGMVIAHNADDVMAGFDRASAEALAAFNDGTLFMERFVPEVRHAEVQFMGDGEGRVMHFGERDCSIQRRYQKLLEEAPCIVMPRAIRADLYQAAAALAASVKYRNAGTAEFLFDVARQEFYFIEVNARIQVEHPVSEMISGHDLVQEQLRIAGGAPLSVSQQDIVLAGHAIECRIIAEDVANDFRPTPGKITSWDAPCGHGIRLDTHMSAGATIPPFYDSMIGKLVVHGADRAEAISRLTAALDGFTVTGVPTTIALHRRIVRHPDFIANRVHTRWLEKTLLAAPQDAAA